MRSSAGCRRSRWCASSSAVAGGNGTPGTAREAARYNMRERIRAVEQGPDGAIWVLEEGSRLLKLTAR